MLRDYVMTREIQKLLDMEKQHEQNMAILLVTKFKMDQLEQMLINEKIEEKIIDVGKESS